VAINIYLALSSGNPIGLDGAAALLAAAEAHGGSSDSPIKLNMAGCSLRHDPRVYPPPPPLGDPARESEGGMGKAGGGKSNAYKRVVAPPPILPEAIVPGLYRCDLANVGGRLAAAMLCEAREVQGPQVWPRCHRSPRHRVPLNSR